MNIRLISGSYKSIKDFEWLDVPMFAVVAGLNGSGKTQMLECIGHAVGANFHQEGREISRHPAAVRHDAVVAVTPSLTTQDVVFLRSSWPTGPDTATLESVGEQVSQAWNSKSATAYEPQWDRLWSLIETKLEKQRSEVSKEEFLRVLPANFMLLTKGLLSVRAAIPSLFVSYLHLKECLRREGLADNEINEELGPQPWDILDSVFERANLLYRVVKPIFPPHERFSLTKISYTLALEDIHTGLHISPSDLSSGEKVMFGVALWFFSFSHQRKSKNGDLPQRLLLLDEPDAHLHPSLTRGFLDVIRSELVEKHGIRVIMTTHSPSTIALTDDAHIFVMNRKSPRIERAPSKWSILSMLTAGFLTIGSNSKCAFVEDTADREFYATVQTILSEPRFGSPSLDPSRSILFIPSSAGHPGAGKGSPSGGINNVKKWVEAISSTQIAGIIDLDDGNVGNERIHVLERHSLESYLLDPLFVYAILLENKEAPEVPGVNLSVHHARMLLCQNQATLQAIADVMLMEMKGDRSNHYSEEGRVSVKYHNGPEVFLDRWFIETSVKRLLEPLKKRFKIKFDHESLTKQYHLISIVPEDLVKILQKIQDA